MTKKKAITILGVTGSVGQSTVDVVLNSHELFNVHAITANKNVTLLAESAKKLNADKAITFTFMMYKYGVYCKNV